jgi:hypothetical protein
MERTINDIIREHEESEEVTICETCGSENVRSIDGMGWCEDCDGCCTTIEVDVHEGDAEDADVGDYVRCCGCGSVIRIHEETLGIVGDGWYCDMCE